MPKAIEMIKKPDYPVRAALYFVEGGHYLFRSFDEGKRASVETAKFVRSVDVAAAFKGQEIDSGWMPAGILRTGHAACGPWFVYSAPQQKVKTWLGDEQVTIPVPRTVLVGIGAAYYLFAVRDDHAVASSELYHAPFPNVYPSGHICWGRNTPPEAAVDKARGVWQMFFDAPFNGDLSAGKCSSHDNDVRVLLRKCASKNKFPLDELLPMQRTLGGTVNELVHRRGE